MSAKFFVPFAILVVFCLCGHVWADCKNGEAALMGYQLTADGLIAFGSDGFPHRETFLAGMRSETSALAAAYRATKNRIFSGENKLLRTVVYKEPAVASAKLNVTLEDFLNEGRYTGRWWDPSDQMGRFTVGVWRDWDTDPQFPKEIAFGFSRGGALIRLGPGSKSKVFWPTLNNQDPDPVGPRFRPNWDKDGYLGDLELIAATGITPSNEVQWNGFAFRKFGDTWIPQVRELIRFEDLVQEKAKEMDLEKARAYANSFNCIGCHHRIDASGNRVFDPLPNFLRTPEDFYGCGYRNRRAVEALIRQREQGLGRYLTPKKD